MKRFLVVCLLAITLTPIQQSHAVFGLSKCEKVRSAVMKNYVTEIKLISEYSKAFGYPAMEIGIQSGSPKSVATRMRVLKKTADFEYKNFEYVLSNASCFTKSQIQYAIKMQDYWRMVKSYTDYGLSYVKVLDRTHNVYALSVLDF
jgi:hypothetical protein